MAHVTHFAQNWSIIQTFVLASVTYKIALYSAPYTPSASRCHTGNMSQTLNNLLTLLNLGKIEEGLFPGRAKVKT